MEPITRYAIIPTHNRPHELLRLVDQLRDDVDVIIVVDNASDPRVDADDILCPATSSRINELIVARDDEQPPNLYKLWNTGLEIAANHALQAGLYTWDVGIFNDDAILPPGWFNLVANGLRRYDAVAASTGYWSPVKRDTFTTTIGQGGISGRMCPWAFVTRGEIELRADEMFRWWYGDNDFDWRARQRGGVIVLAGPTVQNEHANSTTYGELAEQSGRDAETFKAKWGRLP